MKALAGLRQNLPRRIKELARPLYAISQVGKSKHESELTFWKDRFASEGGTFVNNHYKAMMLAVAGEPDTDFLSGKVVADFGCGPRGSLVWAEPAAVRIGIDVLANAYCHCFGAVLRTHGMIYVPATEEVIPMPSDLVDVLFSVNALDHVDNLEVMCDEMLRILKPDGELIASFNLGEPATKTEPQSLNPEILERVLLGRMDVVTYRTARQGPPESVYANFFKGESTYVAGERGFLWVRARKRLVG